MPECQNKIHQNDISAPFSSRRRAGDEVNSLKEEG